MVRYYKSAERANLLIDEMVNNPAFRQLEAERQENFMEEFLLLLKQGETVAEGAVRSIKEELGPCEKYR